MGDEFEGESFDSASDAGDSDLAGKWNELATDAPAPEPTKVIDPPTSWPAERKARWETLSPEDREFIAAREREAHSRISQQGQELARLRSEYEAASSNTRYGQLQQHLADLQEKYEGQLAEIAHRDQRAEFDKFAQDKPTLATRSFNPPLPPKCVR